MLSLSIFRRKEISVRIELAINGAYDQIEYRSGIAPFKWHAAAVDRVLVYVFSTFEQ